MVFRNREGGKIIRKGWLLDVGYTVKGEQTYITLIVKGKKTAKLLFPYDPYFYVDAPEEKAEELKEVKVVRKEEEIKVKRTEIVEKKIWGKMRKLIKVVCYRPPHVPHLKAHIPYPCYEYSIPFARRFMYDLQLSPFDIIKYERKGPLITKIMGIERAESKKSPALSKMAFDIEVLNPMGTPREKEDPIIMISYRSDKEKGVLTFKGDGACRDEKEMLEHFDKKIKDENPDILIGYNSSLFDLPYLKARAEKLKAQFNLARFGGKMRAVQKGLVHGYEIKGRVHVDMYPILRLFGYIGVIKAENYTLDAVSESVLGEHKIDIGGWERINELWEKGEVGKIAEYCLKDAELTYRLAEKFLPLEIELAQTSKLPLFQTTLSTTGQMVESLLMFHAQRRGEIIPPRPTSAEVAERIARPIKGAFVKLPEPGIYSNIAVLDFRGLYPSIIISYNIDPATISESGEHKAPKGTTFKKAPKGLIPEVLEGLLDKRAKIKRALKEMDKDSEEYKVLSARSQALKILANSFYGYLGYARSRWYSRQCAESVTAWGRKHINDTIQKAEEKGFKVLYADTDSVFLIYEDKEKVIEFMNEVNKALPEKMELELEGFYVRGVFVSKKSEEKGAKKKYALLGEDGRIKIRGFELVRRDWSEIAKETQKRVLEIILKEGSKEKAAKVVRETIKALKEGKIELEKLAIKTQLKKEPEKYEVKSPELEAALKLREKGLQVGKGAIISYVIGRRGTSISEKATPLELAQDYDADYYINNQILPAVMKIMKELGYDEYTLIHGGKQQSLEEFF